MIGHNQRFVPSHEKARDLIKSGKIGKVYSFRTAFGHGGPEQWSVDGKDSWFFDKERAFIGAMGDLGVHKADLVRFLLGEEMAEVAAFVETKAKDFATVDDNAVCLLKTESGIVGTLTASWSYVGKEDNSTIIYGEHAMLRLEDDPEYSLVVQYKNGEVEKHQLGQIQSNDEGGQGSSHVIDHFIAALQANRDVPIPGIEGMKSLQVVLGALEAAENGRTVKL
jgi:predicted dehydrogenase